MKKIIADQFIDDYLNWLKKEIRTSQVGNWLEVSTPFLDRHNDFIQLYVKIENGHYFLTDDGYTINDLMINGCDINTEKRQLLLNSTLNGFGISLKGNALFVEASQNDVQLKKHSLIQAILAVNDLFYTNKAHIESFFLEDVASWLDANEIRYISNVKFLGKSGYDHMFDFVIPKSKNSSERLIQVVNHPAKTVVQALVFSLVDTTKYRKENSKSFTIINDSNKKSALSMVDPLKQYDIQPILWKEKDNFLKILSA